MRRPPEKDSCPGVRRDHDEKDPKSNIIEILRTLSEAHSEVKRLIDRRDFAGAARLLEDCCNSADQVAEFIEGSEGSGHATVVQLREYCKAA